MMISRRRTVSVVAGVLFGFVVASVPTTAQAQQAQPKPQLDPRVQAAVDDAVTRAQGQGLPTEPLIDKAFEGTAKHAEPARIVTAVRRLASGLASARQELGEATRAADLVAGAEVLRAGVEPAALAHLRRSRPNASLLVPLVVMADLVSRGVPPNTAADAVLELADRGAADADFSVMQQEVQHDIEAGAAPADAASVRSHGGSSGAGTGAGNAAQTGKSNKGNGNGPGGAAGGTRPAGGGQPAATSPKPRSNGSPHQPAGAGPKKPTGKPPSAGPRPTPGKPAGSKPNGPSKPKPPKGKSPRVG